MYGAGFFCLFCQRFQFVKWDEIGACYETSTFFFNVHRDCILQGMYIDYTTFTEGCADALIFLGQLLPCFDILLVFVDQAAAETPAHAGDF